jgi:hypothetical protein
MLQNDEEELNQSENFLNKKDLKRKRELDKCLGKIKR